jgi:hypothetical protein
MAAVKISAVTGPTPGTVINRRQAFEAWMSCFMSASIAAMSVLNVRFH